VRDRRALFLDRDGVINIERGYVHEREDFEFQGGIFELCRAARSLDYLIVVVTNQAGIGRGYYTEAQFLVLTGWMLSRFAEHNVPIARVYYCPYHPIHGIGDYKRESPDRKPLPGMLLRARADLGLDLADSVLVGDKATDIQAAEAAGVGTKILLRSDAANVEAAPACHVANTLDQIRREFFTPLASHDRRGSHVR
jgi:D-glycero-D-manno-heptose 1,7-bisphosphate phosphatase